MAVQLSHTLPLQPLSGHEAPGTSSKPSFSLQGQSHSVCGRPMEEQGHQKLACLDFGASQMTLMAYGPFNDTWHLSPRHLCLVKIPSSENCRRPIADRHMNVSCSLRFFFLPYLWRFIRWSYKITKKMVIFFFLTAASLQHWFIMVCSSQIYVWYYVIPCVWNIQTRQMHGVRRWINGCLWPGKWESERWLPEVKSFFLGWWNCPKIKRGTPLNILKTIVHFNSVIYGV